MSVSAAALLLLAAQLPGIATAAFVAKSQRGSGGWAPSFVDRDTVTTTSGGVMHGGDILLRMSSVDSGYGKPTELPDSLEDAAEIAAAACKSFADSSGPTSRCRVDFDTSVGDETYTTLKSSTEFMQNFVSALCYATVPGLMEWRQGEMMRVAQAKAELQALVRGGGDEADDGFDAEEWREVGGEAVSKEVGEDQTEEQERKHELMKIITHGGLDPENAEWTGPKARIYFPDEGSAALARRDWRARESPDQALVPPCVEFSSCGGVQLQDISNDKLVFFFCPRASEAEFVEEILYKHEETCGDNLSLSVFVNPLLVDMGVTGFGMAGRMLRERLIDQLVPTYYLRTLQWGALTRVWPRQFTVWQEDSDEEDGYRMIKAMDRLPSNPEVEDIYDIENGNMSGPENQKRFGFLDSLGDFVNGMTRL